MNDYLSKPVRKKDLIIVMKKWLPKNIVKTKKSEITTPLKSTFSDEDKTSESEFLYLNKKVLVVEDNRVNSALVVSILESFGAIVTTAFNGQLGVEAVQQQLFDVIFMDCDMPVMDGYEATEHICKYKKQNNIKSMPVIALTARTQSGEREQCLAAGMDDYFTKPVRKSTVLDMLKKWCVDH
jgi:CheY-like chemotaxis protein